MFCFPYLITFLLFSDTFQSTLFNFFILLHVWYGMCDFLYLYLFHYIIFLFQELFPSYLQTYQECRKEMVRQEQ